MLAAVRTAAAGIAPLPGGSTVPGTGQTIGGATADWWNWAESFQSPANPFTDSTGAVAGQHQSGPVFNLAGTGPGSGPVSRNIDIPAGKFVVLPLLNIIVAAGPDATFPSTAAEAQAFGTTAISPGKLFATIDGVPVSQLATHREASPVNFTLKMAVGNPSGFPAGTYTDANSDGYWLMLPPMSAGTHVLHFGGTSDTFFDPAGTKLLDPFSVDVTDTIHVGATSAVPLPAAFWPALGTFAMFAPLVIFRRTGGLRRRAR